jgi:hypothetical protein
VASLQVVVLMDFSRSKYIQEAQLHLRACIDNAHDNSDIDDEENHEKYNADDAEPAFWCPGNCNGKAFDDLVRHYTVSMYAALEHCCRPCSWTYLC